MVSSTFKDLKEHRAALMEALPQYKLHANGMENDNAKVVDVIESSLQMVRDSEAYIGVIGLKYGQTPESPDRNPEQLSITELEFDEAQRLERPILLFVMGDDHPLKKADIEKEPAKEAKLNAFRERAKKIARGSGVNRVYAGFNSLDEFKGKLGSSLAELGKHLDSAELEETVPKTREASTIPRAPDFYAEPDYLGSHDFVGRDAELQTLSDWALKADPTNLLLFEAIGGNGKSMLTWEWINHHAPRVRNDWAGYFWYSFYEKGAVMADFCGRAVAYTTGLPLKEFEKLKTAQLKDLLLAQLHSKPWLFVLDGLERVLVAYHRLDAAEVPDEEANNPTDKIVSRDPCDAIRDEDTDLLRALAGAKPSKILASTRLTPRVLLNPSGQTIPGAKRLPLPGLRPPDAEKLLRSCAIEGDSASIQAYLTSNCDNHPLVIGILGGLISNYLPAKGDFDRWVADPDAGGGLNLGKLDLIQRRNHILKTALDDLPPASRELLSTLALLPDSVNYEALCAFNPHLPPEPDWVYEPVPLEDDVHLLNRRLGEGNETPEEAKAELREAYEADLARWQQYQQAIKAWPDSPACREALGKLPETVRDLEQRGLLQYDHNSRRHDLHPVVRGVAAGGLNEEEMERCGQRVLDHFTSLPHNPFEKAERLEDLRPGLNIVRTLIKLGRFDEAAEAYRGDLARALIHNLEAHAEILSLLRSLFPAGWGALPKVADVSLASYLANDAAIALGESGEYTEALATYGASLRADLEEDDWIGAQVILGNISSDFLGSNRLFHACRAHELASDFATVLDGQGEIFDSLHQKFVLQSTLGAWAEAEATWELLDGMGRKWPRAEYGQGDAELAFARAQYWQGCLQESHLASAECLAQEDNNRGTVRNLHRLRAEWRLDRGEWRLAADSFSEAVRMARESGFTDAASEAGLALAKHHLGQLVEPREEAGRLANEDYLAHHRLAELWLAIGDVGEAEKHALAAYRWAWADGEPYVRRYFLTKATELLERLQVPVPELPPYDPAKDEPFPWEAQVRAAIEKLREEKAARDAKPKDGEN